MSVSTFTQPDYTAQTGATYKANLDGAADVMKRLGAAFAPHAQSTPNMTVRLDAGAIFDGTTLTEVAAQSTGTITAPSANPRIDRVVIDRATGVASVITGTEGASPAAPAITAGKVPIAQVSFVVSQSSIVNADITDERQLGVLGLDTAAFEAVGTGANQVVQLDGSAKLPAVDGSQLTGVSDAVAQNNILLNAFRIAINGGLAVLNMQDGIVDEFEDETGVDTGASTNEIYDATGDSYSGVGPSLIAGATGTTRGTMTGGGGNAAAFDDDTTKTAAEGAAIEDVAQTVAARNVGKDWGAGNDKKLSKIKCWGVSDQQGFCTDALDVTITLEGSADDSSWTGLGSVIVTAAGGPSATQELTSTDKTTAYRYVRVGNHQAGQATTKGSRFAEVDIYEEVTLNMTLISATFTAEATPTEARIVLFEQDVDAITLNTDLKAYASRDGGTTYTQITLADEGDFETGKRILAGTVDISGQPAGTSMKWKVETLNTKELRLHGVALQWS